MTKREILRFIAGVWDLLGLLYPISTTWRIRFQNLWRCGVDWDQPLTDELREEWSTHLYESMDHIKEKISRSLTPEHGIKSFELHAFSDGGSEAYGGCVYFRWILDNDDIDVRFVASKAFVVPVKGGWTIPRTELMGALIMCARMKLKIKRTHRYNVAAKGCFVLAIVTLDGSHLEYTINGTTTGLDCLAFVAQKLELDNMDYYGFRYRIDGDGEEAGRWLVLEKAVKKQLDRCAKELKLHFGVMYFVENAHSITDLTVRHQYYLQMKHDILFSRVSCTLEDAVYLAAYSLQADLGAWEDSRMDFEQLKEYRHVPSRFVDFPDSGKYYKLVEEIVQYYRQLGEIAPAEAEAKYIALTQKLPNFGEEKFPCENWSVESNRRNGPCTLGVSRNGITIYPQSSDTSTTATSTSPLMLRWESIKHLICSKRVFSIHRIHQSKAINLVMTDVTVARYLYYYCVQMHGFYIKYWTARNSISSLPSVERSSSSTQPIAAFTSGSLPPPDIQLCSQRDSFVSGGTSSTAENSAISRPISSTVAAVAASSTPVGVEQPFSHQGSFLSSEETSLSNGLAARHTRFVSNSLSQLPVYRAKQLEVVEGIPMRAVVSSIANETRLPSYRHAPDYATVMQQRDVYLRQNVPTATATSVQQQQQQLNAPAQYCSPVYDDDVVQPPSPFLDNPPMVANQLPRVMPPPVPQLASQHVPQPPVSIPDVFQLMVNTNSGDNGLTYRLLEEYKQSILQSQAYHNNSVSTPNLSTRDLYDSAADYVNADAIIEMQQQRRGQAAQRGPEMMNMGHRQPPPPPPLQHRRGSPIEEASANRPLSACSEDSNATFLIRNAPDYEFVDVTANYERQRIMGASAGSSSYQQENPYETLTPMTAPSAASSSPLPAVPAEDRPRYRPRVPRHSSSSKRHSKSSQGGRAYNSPSHRVYANVMPGRDSPASSLNSTNSAAGRSGLVLCSSPDFSTDREEEEGFDSGDADSESCNEYIVNQDVGGDVVLPTSSGVVSGRMRRLDSDDVVNRAPLLSAASRIGLTVSRANLLWEESEAAESRIPKDEKRQRMEAVLREGPARIRAEFDAIPLLAKNKDCIVAASEENRARNCPAAKSILPYDESRVKITPTNENMSGYVNASHVRVRVKGREEWYIASQTPSSLTTARDFWYMVWETQIHVVAKLCDSPGGGPRQPVPSDLDPGCAYLPTEPGEENALSFDDLTVSLISCAHSGSFVTSRLTLRQRAPGPAIGNTYNPTRTLWYFRYLDWDRHEDVPLNVYNFSRFLDEVSSLNRHVSSERSSSMPGPPVLFHCSAGAGRSGLAILIQVMISCLDHNQDINLETVLTRLRGCRMHLVETAEQYAFVYRALIAYLYNSRLI